MIRTALVALGLSLAGGWAIAAPVLHEAAGGPPLVQQPTLQEIDRYFPERARRLHKSGVVGLRCHVAGGSPADCQVTFEDPADFGFGDAAVKIARRMQARLPAGADPASTIEFTIRFPGE